MGSSDDGTMVHGDMAPDHPPDNTEDVAEDTTLLAHATKTAPTSPRDLQHVLSNSMAKYSDKKLPAKPPTMTGRSLSMARSTGRSTWLI